MSIIKRQTILGTTYSYIGIIIGTITQAILIPNYFSIEENGVIQLILRWMSTLIMFTGLGYSSAGTRFFRYFRSPDDKHNGYLFNGIVVLLLGTIASVLFLVFFKNSLISSDSKDNTLFVDYYYLIVPLTIASGVFVFFDNYAKLLYDTVVGSFLNQFLQRFFVFVSICLFANGTLDFNQFIYTWTLGMCLPAFLMVAHCYRLGNFSLKPSPFFIHSAFKKEFVLFALFSIVTGLSNIVISNLDTFMVYQYLGLGLTGIYNTCLFFGSIMTVSYLASIKASSAIVVDAIELDDKTKLKQIFIKSSVTQMIFGTCILIVTIASLDNAFLLIKPEYSVGKSVIIIIGVAKLYDLASGVNTLILGYSKYYKIEAAIVISFIGLLYLLNYFLIPTYGLVGAGVSSFIAIFYYNSVRNFFIWKYFNIHPYTSALLKILLIGSLVLGIGLWLPDFKGSKIIVLLSIVYKSSIVGFLFLGIIYKLKISAEINNVINVVLSKLKIKVSS